MLLSTQFPTLLQATTFYHQELLSPLLWFSYKWNHTVPYLLCLVSFITLQSSFIHVVACISSLFLLISKQYSILMMSSLGCRGKKIISPLPSEFLAETPVINDRLTEERQKGHVYFQVYLGDTQEKISNS